MRAVDVCYGLICIVALVAIVLLFFRNKMDENETSAEAICDMVNDAKAAASGGTDDDKLNVLRRAVQFCTHQTRWRLNMGASLFAGMVVSAAFMGATSSQRLGLFFLVFCAMSLCQYYIDSWQWAHVDEPASYVIFNIARAALTGEDPRVELWFGDKTKDCAEATKWEAAAPVDD